ncbi:MAG TPA: terminase family protein [Acidimicrobiales bacterium]|nr:terminase family protein [Acidimicrobiales bacterium]
MGVLAATAALVDRPPPDHGGWEPYPWQIPPDHIPPAGAWLQLGGRGTGKTDGAAHYVIDHVRGPACDHRLPGGHRMAIIAPTLGDASDACVNGPSGLKAYWPEIREVTRKGGTYVLFPGGAEGKLFGAHGPEDVERLRAGGNRCLAWWEELAAWAKLDEAMRHSRYGLRLGTRPHIVASTTPKPRLALKGFIADPKTRVTRGKTSEAIHLDQMVRDQLYADYGGTRLGRQELEGELLDDVEGALWTVALVDAGRISEPPDLDRVVVAIDPAGGTGEHNDETGIVACGRAGSEFYVLADRSCRGTPQQWADRALLALDEFCGDRVVAESNYGGQMVEHTLRSVRPNVPVRVVHASRGKRQRAEPVSALYEQGRVHHVGMFPQLEDQMLSWVPDSGTSPDRMDALVWAVTDLAESVKPRGARMTYVSRR